MSRTKSRSWRQRKLRPQTRKFKIDFEASKEIWNTEREAKREEHKKKRKEKNKFDPLAARIPKKSQRTGTEIQVTIKKPRQYPWKPEIYVPTNCVGTLPLT